jgi:hypothetical protein
MSIQVQSLKIDWHEGLSICCSEPYLRTISSEYGWIGGFADSSLLCLLPYNILRIPFLRLARFTSETIFLENPIELEKEKDFLNGVVDYFRSMGVDLIIPATFNSLFRTYPDGANAVPYGTYIVDLQQSEDALWKNVHPKHRNKIRIAKKTGVIIKNGIEYVNTANTLVQDSFERSTKGLLNSLRLKIRMNEHSIREQAASLGDHSRIFVAEYEGIIQGCAVIYYSDYCAYYMHGGSVAHPMTGSTNLLQWEAMSFFRNLGVRFYNFVGARIDPEPGSKQESLKMFKGRFGGELKQGYMWRYSLHPLKSRLYSVAAKIRSGGDIVDQEKHRAGSKPSPAECGEDTIIR